MQKITLIAILISSLNSIAQTPECLDFEQKCAALVQGQDKDIVRLHRQVAELETELSKNEKPLPFYIWLGAGVLAGMGTTLYLLKR